MTDLNGDGRISESEIMILMIAESQGIFMILKELCQKISEVIIDYRDREFGRYDQNHVERWIYQFEEHEREIVLQETLHILERNYITLKQFEQFVHNVIESPLVHCGKQEEYWKNVTLLSIQKDGNSQRELNNILLECLLNKFGLEPSTSKENIEFIYLDDFIFLAID